MNYFQHDYRSRLDKKLLKIRRKHGICGFGVYWALVEMLHEGNGFIEMDTETIAYELQCDEQIIKDVIEICFDYFEGNVTCNRVIENLEYRRSKASEKSKIATENINKRWEKYRNRIQSDTNGIQSVYEQNTNSIQNHTIEKEKDIVIDKEINKEKLLAVYKKPIEDVFISEDNNEVDYFQDDTEIVISRNMLERLADKFVAIDSRYKLQSFLSEINEDFNGFDNFLDLYLEDDASAKRNYINQLNQYQNGIFK